MRNSHFASARVLTGLVAAGVVIAVVLTGLGKSADSPAPPYRNPTLSVDARVADLIGRMTLEEKVGQLMMWDARSEDLSFINTRHAGSILHILGAKIGRAMDLAAKERHGIPLLVGEDGIHGHSFWKGSTIFPTQLALAASWNPELIEKVGRVTAEEMAPTGIHWTFSPVLCLTRDLRWGRTGETFGEDPYLIGEFGAALIRGYQGKGLSDPTAVLATAKHYAGYSETQGGTVRACRARRGNDLHDRLRVHRRSPDHDEPLAAHRRSQERMGLRRSAGD
jgi:beta-glucosidase